MKVTSERIDKDGFKPTRIVLDIETEREADALLYMLRGGGTCLGVPLSPIVELLEKAKNS